uniref:Uncharacterized protein n=1 Tax=Anopheles culicifacies TaxID=139723 RepID=A0A182LYQ1_9DIPT
MNKSCARCQKVVYPIEELKCLDKLAHPAPDVSWLVNIISTARRLSILRFLRHVGEKNQTSPIHWMHPNGTTSMMVMVIGVAPLGKVGDPGARESAMSGSVQ